MKRKGWIKLYRKLLDDDSDFQKMTIVQQMIALQMLLRANYTAGQWFDRYHQITVPVKRGPLVTSRQKIIEWFQDGDLSEQQVKTALKRLESIGFIKKETTNFYTLITIVNYRRYQGEENPLDDVQIEEPVLQRLIEIFDKSNQEDNQVKTLLSQLFQAVTDQDLNQHPTSNPTTIKEGSKNIKNNITGKRHLISEDWRPSKRAIEHICNKYPGIKEKFVEDNIYKMRNYYLGHPEKQWGDYDRAFYNWMKNAMSGKNGREKGADSRPEHVQIIESGLRFRFEGETFKSNELACYRISEKELVFQDKRNGKQIPYDVLRDQWYEKVGRTET